MKGFDLFGKLFAAEDVEVEVRDDLAAVFADVEGELVAAFGYPPLFRHGFRRENHVGYQSPMLVLQARHRRDMFFRNNEHVHRGFGQNVVNNGHLPVLEQYFAVNDMVHDIAKDAVGHKDMINN